MKKKALLGVLLIAIIGLCFAVGIKPIPITANAEDNLAKAEAIFRSNSKRSVEIYDSVMSNFTRLEYEPSGETKTAYTDEFAGAFVDENGIMNVGIASKNFSDIARKTSIQHKEQVVVLQQKYSFNHLRKVQKTITPVMVDYSVTAVGIDEVNNKVEVNLKEEKNVQRIINYLKEKNVYSEDALNFIVNPEREMEKHSKAYGGNKCENWLFSYGTICVNAYDYQTGQMGIITNQHVAKNDTMYLGSAGALGAKIGSASKSQLGGTIDAAFIPFANQSSWEVTRAVQSRTGAGTYNIRLGNEGQTMVGNPIIKFGQAMDMLWGKVRSRYIDETMNYGTASSPNYVTIEDTLGLTTASQQGDSGGPIFYDGGNDGLFLIGMTCGGNDSVAPNTVACRISEVMRIFNVTPITHETSNMFITANIGSSEIQIIGNNYIPSDGIVEVPESINGRKVVQFNEYAFAHHPELKKVYIPNTVRAIAATAFYNSKNVVLHFADGFVQRRSGGAAIYIVAGGFPFFVSNWANLQGGARPYCDVTYEQQMLMPKVPDDGTNVRILAGTVYCYAGGCAFGVYNWANVGGSQPSTAIDGTAIDFAARPKDGTFVRTLNGTKYVYAGKAPIKISSWNNIDGWHPATLVDGLSMILTDKPINDTFVTTKSGKIYQFKNGKASLVNQWSDVGGIKPSVLVDETVIVTYM